MKKSDKGEEVCFLKVFFGVMVIVSLFVGVVSAGEAEAIIIDTEKGVPGFWTEPARDLPGNWWYVQDHPDSSADGWFVTKAYPPGQGSGSFWYTIAFPEMGECKGIWMASLPHSGKYEVFAWVPDPDPFDPYLDESTPPSDYLPTKKAQYKIFHNGGVATVTIDQNVNKGGFTSLGVFDFDTTARVELSSNGVEFWRCVAFDAVKFVPVQTPIDTTDPGNNQTGKGTEDTVPQLAPLNPDFVAYKENPPETFFGYIPPPMNLSHLDQIPVEGLPRLDTLPSRFDWRDTNNVTPVKNQGPCETGWIFGTTSVLESAVLIGESLAYNFSEQSVALCVDRSWIYLYDNYDDPCNAGGWSGLASEVFIKKGSVLESCNPYVSALLDCGESCVCDDCPPIKKVDGYRLATNNGSQIEAIKNAVYSQGPVTMAYSHSGTGEYWIESCGTIYDLYPCDGYVGHLASIIGWDDDVPHPNPNHAGTGAWIVKNSFGVSWGNNGFFYLAYNSSCVKEIAYLTYKDDNPDEELLYWDEAGYVGNGGYDGYNSAWMANVFTAPKPGNLTHVDFWTTSNNALYELYVWNGSFGSELAHQTGTCQELGYYSIPLNKPASIDAGQQFTVAVNMTTPGYDYPIAVEYKDTFWLGVDPPIQPNVSFVRRTDGEPWADLVDYGENACLRARMIVIVPPEITAYAPESPVNDYGCAKRSFNITINQTVNVSWQINGTEVQTNASVTKARYTNMSAVNGTWNVSAVVSNANGTDMQTWVWTVTSPCFIATAAYGTPLHEDIDVLRDFRDEYLMSNPAGRAFVKIYYDTSPPLANAIRDNEGLRTAVREGVVKPVVHIARIVMG
jgi:C1A family cysteine protease